MIFCIRFRLILKSPRFPFYSPLTPLLLPLQHVVNSLQRGFGLVVETVQARRAKAGKDAGDPRVEVVKAPCDGQRS